MGAAYTKEELEEAICNSQSKKEVLERLGLCVGGASYRMLNKRIEEWSISIDHFPNLSERMKQRWSDGGTTFSKIPLEDVLVENSTYCRTHLKKRLFEAGLKKPECEMCGQGKDWHGIEITHVLDHVNGVRDDNRLENLRIVCPNCNSTLPTHAGRNKSPKYLCSDCGCGISRKCKRCKACESKRRTGTNTAINWPSDVELHALVWKMPKTKLAKQLGVSDVSITKRCKKFEIAMPPNGHWSKKERKDSNLQP